MQNRKQIWLEVTNVRIEGTEDGKRVKVQLKGDKADQEPLWWPVAPDGEGERAEEVYRNIADGLDKKRTVLASLQPAGPRDPPEIAPLHVVYVRVQLGDSSAR